MTDETASERLEAHMGGDARLRKALEEVVGAIGDWSRPTNANGMIPAGADHPLCIAARRARESLTAAPALPEEREGLTAEDVERARPIVEQARKAMLDRLDDDVIGEFRQSHLVFGLSCAAHALAACRAAPAPLASVPDEEAVERGVRAAYEDWPIRAVSEWLVEKSGVGMGEPISYERSLEMGCDHSGLRRLIRAALASIPFPDGLREASASPDTGHSRASPNGRPCPFCNRNTEALEATDKEL